MRKGIADMEYPSLSKEEIEKKSALLLSAMNERLSTSCDLTDLCKVEEAARMLGISKREVWFKASKGELTPCLQFTSRTMYAIKGLNPIGLVSIGGLFTLSKGAIPDWFSRGTGTFSTNMLFPIRIDSILDESWLGEITVNSDLFEPPMFLWKDAPLETADKFQIAVSVGEPTDSTIHLDDFLYLRGQVNSLIGEDGKPEDGQKMEDRFQVFHDMDNLMFGEVTIELASDSMLVISARGVSKDIHYIEMGLFRRRPLKLNVLGETFLNIVLRNKLQPKGGASPTLRKRVSDLWALLKTNLDIEDDPFQEDWKPNFKVIDRMKMADDRAKANAKHVPLDGNNKDHGVTYQHHDEQDTDDFPFDDENDDAGRLIRRIVNNV